MNAQPAPRFVPVSFYEKYVPLAKCESEPSADQKSKNIYVKGTFFYDSVEDNPEYDYTWGFVRVDSIVQPIKVRGLQFMNRAFDLDEVYIQFVNWLQWEPAQSKVTKHIDWDRAKRSCLDDLGEARTDLTSDCDESLFGRAQESDTDHQEKDKNTKKNKKKQNNGVETIEESKDE